MRDRLTTERRENSILMTLTKNEPTGASRYAHNSIRPHTSGYLWNPILAGIEREAARLGRAPRIVDLGCGAGFFLSELAARGYDVTGVDPADSAVRIFRESGRPGRMEQGQADETLAARVGQFDIIVSMEVVEHVFEPRIYAAAVHALLVPGGVVIMSTPYHGYLKNLSIAITNGFDKHFTALWDYGHIKFWSRATLTTLLEEQHLRVERFERVGRALPALAKSMILYARRDK